MCPQSGKSHCHYRPQRSWGKVMFLQVCVILFTGGVPDQVHPPDQVHIPQDQLHPPRTRYIPQTRYTPWDQVHPLDQVHPPRTRYPPGPGTPPLPGDQVPSPGTRYPLPPGTEHAGRYGLRAGGAHPTGMQSCFCFYSEVWSFLYRNEEIEPGSQQMLFRTFQRYV